MMVAIIILTALLSFQFVSAIERDCMGLGLMFGVEIILFAYIAKNSIKGLTKQALYAIINPSNERGNKMLFILLVLLALVVSFLITAGLVWLLCWLLPAIGIVAIGTFTIVFSWKLALVIWLIIALLRPIFSSVSRD